MNDGFFVELLNSLTFYIPYLIAYSVGIILALTFWKRWPRPCLFTLIAFLIKLSAVIGISLALTLALRGDIPFAAYESLVFQLGVVDASAYTFLLLAIFKARSEPHRRRRPSWYDEPEEFYDEPARQDAPQDASPKAPADPSRIQPRRDSLEERP
jgi:hypothetical protein